MKRLILAGLFAGALVPTAADGRTWTVGRLGADFPLVAPALAAASDGDTILVRRGVYREDLVLARRLALVGEGRPVLIGTGEGTVVSIEAPGCEVRGFDIEGSGSGLTNRMDAAIRVASPGARIRDNRMHRVFYGVVLEGAPGCEIVGNEIRGFAELGFGRRGDGLYVYRAPNTQIRGNRILGMRDAIYLQYSPKARVSGNIAETSRYGLHDMFSDDAEIRDNVFRDCLVGANIMNCRRVALTSNRFERNRGISSVGLALKECDESRVEGNVLSDNARGLQVDGSSRNRFAGNRFRDNDTALFLFASAEENVFTENEFRDNWSHVVASGRLTTTRFAESGRGNRWSGYRGFDFDGDGVGESPRPLLPVFEKLEGNNPAVRLFLRTPAADALELAARALPPSPDEVVDPSPLVRAPDPGSPKTPAQRGARALLAGLLVAGLLAVSGRKVSPCSKSSA